MSLLCKEAGLILPNLGWYLLIISNPIMLGSRSSHTLQCWYHCTYKSAVLLKGICVENRRKLIKVERTEIFESAHDRGVCSFKMINGLVAPESLKRWPDRGNWKGQNCAWEDWLKTLSIDDNTQFIPDFHCLHCMFQSVCFLAILKAWHSCYSGSIFVDWREIQNKMK